MANVIPFVGCASICRSNPPDVLVIELFQCLISRGTASLTLRVGRISAFWSPSWLARSATASLTMVSFCSSVRDFSISATFFFSASSSLAS